MERSTGRYGVVTASCVQLSALQRAYASVVGHGAVLTQSYLVEGDASQALALQLLGQSVRAAEVIDAMTNPQFDADFSLRQYIVLDALGEVAAFSGVGPEPFAGHLDASDESFSIGIAGNLLTGAEVLEAAALGFRDDLACDLEERLVSALVASSAGGLGDARCVVDGRPAQSAWMQVAGASGQGDLDIRVDAAPGIDPIIEVLARFSEWRSGHPCPVGPQSNEPFVSAPKADPSDGCSMAHAGSGSIEGWSWWLVLLGRRRARGRPRPSDRPNVAAPLPR
jgi:uncharacterized Ntn-hydrolase superfamily protein